MSRPARMGRLKDRMQERESDRLQRLLRGLRRRPEGDVPGIFHKLLARRRKHEVHDLPRVFGGRADRDHAGGRDERVSPATDVPDGRRGFLFFGGTLRGLSVGCPIFQVVPWDIFARPRERAEMSSFPDPAGFDLSVSSFCMSVSFVSCLITTNKNTSSSFRFCKPFSVKMPDELCLFSTVQLLPSDFINVISRYCRPFSVFFQKKPRLRRLFFFRRVVYFSIFYTCKNAPFFRRRRTTP